jgi:hypothetical protein
MQPATGFNKAAKASVMSLKKVRGLLAGQNAGLSCKGRSGVNDYEMSWYARICDKTW